VREKMKTSFHFSRMPPGQAFRLPRQTYPRIEIADPTLAYSGNKTDSITPAYAAQC